MLARVLEDLGADDADLDAPRLLQPLAHRLGDRERMVERAAEGLARFLELRPMVALRLDIIAHPGLGRDQRARVGAPLFAFGAALHLAHGGVEARDAFGDRRRIVGQLDQLVAGDPEVGEHRVGKDFGELVGAAAVPGFGRERLHIDVEDLGQPQQYAGGHRPLIALEMVEIGSGDAELAGHLALVEPALAAQPLHARAEKELSLGHVVNLS